MTISANITVTPTSGLVTTETGGTATFDVVLDTQPTADVTITIASGDTTEGTTDVSTLTFTSSNWNVAQTVTATGVNDLIDDGNVSYTIVTGTASSSDGAYNGLNVSDVSISNTDNDTAGITVTPTSGLVTNEAGGTTTFDVVLDTQPTADVTITIASGDTTEGTTDVSTLTFTSSNWNVAQTVTATGVNDLIDDGNVSYTIVTGTASSSDGAYNGLNVNDVSISNTDNDTAGITVTPTSGLVTNEAGGTATFDVVLDTQPTADVTITIASGDTTEGTTDVSTLTFTSSNWNVAQTVTVTGVDDAINDGDVAYSILTGVAVSNDVLYDGRNTVDVQVTNQDDDPVETAGITVTPTSDLVTTEAGGTAIFDVVLDTQPTSNVTIDVSSSDSSEGTTNVSSLQFTTDNWSLAQTVLITGVDDSERDRNVAYSIALEPAASSDVAYYLLDADDVSVVNADNEKGNGGKNTGGGNGGGKGGGKKTTTSTDLNLATAPEYTASSATWLDQQTSSSTDTTKSTSTGSELISSTSEYVLADSVHSDGSVVDSETSTSSDDDSQPWDSLSDGYNLESFSTESSVQNIV